MRGRGRRALTPGRAALLVHGYLEEGGLAPGAPPLPVHEAIRACLVDQHGYPRDAVAVTGPEIVRALVQRLARQDHARRAAGEPAVFRFEQAPREPACPPQLAVALAGSTAGRVPAPPAPGAGPEAATTGAGGPAAGDVLRLLRRLASDAFERAMARLLAALGCEAVRRVGGAGDGGVDLVALLPFAPAVHAGGGFALTGLDGALLLCQAKRYALTRPIGPAAVREFATAVAGWDQGRGAGSAAPVRPVVGLLVTSGTVTRGAAELARRHGIVSMAGGTAALVLAAAAARAGIRPDVDAVDEWLTNPPSPPP